MPTEGGKEDRDTHPAWENIPKAGVGPFLNVPIPWHLAPVQCSASPLQIPFALLYCLARRYLNLFLQMNMTLEDRKLASPFRNLPMAEKKGRKKWAWPSAPQTPSCLA